MTLTTRPGLAILFVVLAVLVLFLALSLSGPPAQAQDGSVPDQDEEPDVSYVTVVVDRTPEPSVAQFTVTWNDAHEGKCSTQYNAYLTDYFVDTEEVHLGSATSDDVQIVKTVDSSGMDNGLGYRVVLICGDTDDYRFVSGIGLPSLLPSGTYSSEPALIGLVVDSGSLEPAFHQYKFSYVVDDVPTSDDRITVTATAKDEYYGIVFVEGHVHYLDHGCGGDYCSYHYSTQSHEKLDTLEDVDSVTPGFQLDLEEGQTDFSIHVHPLVDGGNVYQFSVTSTVTVRNSPATGQPTISGTAQVGEKLTADTSGIEDVDGLSGETFTYQWVSSDGTSDTDIAGATIATYTPVSANEGQTIKVRVSFTDDADNQEMLTSAPTAAVAAPAQADSEDEPSELSYLTVVVTEDDSDPDNVVTTFTITWNDAEDCSASYNAYLDDVVGDPIHLGSAASEGEQIAASLTNVSAESMGFDAKLYCGMIGSGRLVDILWIFEYSRIFDTVPISRAYLPKPGTYSTEPGLTVLTVSSGTLTPAFHSQTLNYTVPDVANADGRITLTTTKADYYNVAFIPGSFYFYIAACSPGGQQTSLSYQDDTGNPLYPLTDADANTPGFQMELDEGENVFKIHVWPNCASGHAYKLTVTRAANAPANTPATGAPTISGAAQVGETLTASTSGIADADGLTGATFSYQWLSSRDTEIQGATGAVYILVPGDAGKTIKVRVTFTDDEGNAETLTSAATGAVAPRPNSPATGAPTIGGTAQVGQTLTASTSGIADADGLTGATFSYQWLSSRDTEIQGATGAAYILVPGDAGKTIKVRVTFTDDEGNAETLTSAATGAVAPRPNSPATGAPTIGGTAQVGQTLTVETSGIADTDGLTGATFSYQWLSSRDTEIQGATGAAYILVPGDAGKTIKVRVTFTDDEGNAETLTSAATGVVAPRPNSPATGAPTIGGTAQVGETLTASTSGIADADGLTGATFSYQWLSSRDTEIQGATGAAYILVPGDAGKTIKVRVTFTDDEGNAETLTSAATGVVAPRPNSPATGAPTIGGTAQVGETLTASTSGIADADGLTGATFSYRWLSSRDTEIQGATGAAYILVPGDAGKTIKVRVTFTDDEGNAETLTSAATGVVAPRPNSPATGAPTIGGTAQVGETLTASTSGIADADGLTGATFSYQWLSSRDTEIQGATGAAYILVPGDAGKTIKVRVTFTDDEGNAETLTSAATGVVAPRPNSPATGAPTIGGTAQVGETLTASTSGIADADGLTGATFSYQWLGSRDAEIQGATNATYTPVAADEGKAIKVQVSFTDDRGNAESLTSAPTSAVEANANNPATGLPTISGTAQVGETLTAGITGIADADGLSGESFTYQWVSGDGTTDTDIENATGATYKLVDADQGKAIKVRVTFTDGGGNEETLTSAPTGPVWGDGRPGAPRNLAATPGNKEVTLSWDPPADNGNAPATGYRIEWRVDGKDYDKTIWGTARSTTYTTNVNANLANGVKYFFRVKAGNGSGNSQGPYGPASGEVSATPTSGSAVDLGTPVLSNTENLHHGMVRLDWEDVEDAGWYVVQYYHVKGGEWLDLPAEGVDIAFHGSSAVVSNLHGLSWLRVGAMSCAGESEWSQIEQLFGTNASDWEGVPVPEVEEGDEIEPCPVVLGTPVLSDTETLHHGMVRLDWEDIEDAGWYVVQYYHVKGGEWLDLPAEGVDIAFHGSSAVVSNLHGLSWLRVRAMSCAGASEWSQIEQLFGTNASDWEDVPVPEVAKGDQIEPCSEDADTPDNSPATGAPTISGTVQVGETLTANTSGVADADGLSNVLYEYQWLADDSEIAGATGLTYTLTDSEESKAITVQVSFTDDAGNEETLTSAATDAVAAAPQTNSPATGAPDISGTAQVGQTLTADTSGIADADGLGSVQYEYQWLADDSDISGATNATYTLTDSEEGKAIKVQVSFTDDTVSAETRYTYRIKAINGAGTSERSRWSHIDTPAAPVPDKPTGLEATASHDSVTLTWEDPGDDSITGYVILRRLRYDDPSGHFDELVADTGTAATTYTDDTVKANTHYTYRIKAINGAGVSERSRWFHIQTQEAP